jgi:flagellar protein FlaG
MKLEGMDAARVSVVSVQTLDPSYGDAGAAFTGKDSVDIGERLEPGKRAGRGQAPIDRQLYDRQFRQEESFSEKSIKEALDKVNRILSGSDRRFEISIHEKTREVMVKVVDTLTNETIREIPPKKIVDIIVNLCEMAGIIFDQKG